MKPRKKHRRLPNDAQTLATVLKTEPTQPLVTPEVQLPNSDDKGRQQTFQWLTFISSFSIAVFVSLLGAYLTDKYVNARQFERLTRAEQWKVGFNRIDTAHSLMGKVNTSLFITFSMIRSDLALKQASD